MSRTARILAVAATAWLVAALVRLAWVGDDGYITLRTVENLARGHGPVWNLGERVQTFTHPLWMLVLAAGRLVSGECYFTTIALSLAASTVAALWIVVRAGDALASLAVALVLLSSRAFTEYAACGLENPLTYLLLAWLVHEHTATGGAKTFRMALCTGLLAATRMDLAVLAAPALLATLRSSPLRPWLLRTCLGLLPFLAWSAFAIVYYGSPFPITAESKAFSHGLPTATVLGQGLWYVAFGVLFDPPTMVGIGLGIAVGLRSRTLGSRALALGALLYCGYVVRVGGDYMAGRFWTPAFVVAAAVLGRALRGRPRRAVATGVGALALGFVVGLPAWCRSPADEQPPQYYFHGIIDERAAYVGSMGLWSPQRDVPDPDKTGRMLQAIGRTRRIVATFGRIGRFAFEGGERLYAYDTCLCDALLARLPIQDPKKFRVGHVVHRVPEGYLETIAFGGDRIRHPGLARYYGAIHRIVSGPLFGAERWRAILGYWTGAFDADLQAFVRDEYHAPPRIEVAAAELAAELPDPLPGLAAQWYDEPQARLVNDGGLDVRFPVPIAPGSLHAQLAGEANYRFTCRLGDAVTATVDLDLTKTFQFSGLTRQVLALPPGTSFDRVTIEATSPLGLPAVGSLR